MKTMTIAATMMILGAFSAQQDTMQKQSVEQRDLYACGIWPLCDPDNYTPLILQPTDSKTETQDAKDEKVA